MAPTTPLPPSAVHERFQTWAAANGITSTSIQPAALPNAGLGIVSTEPIPGPEVSKAEHRLGHRPGCPIAFTPISALLTLENVREFAPKLPTGEKMDGLSTHALLAAAIASEVDNRENPWRPWIEVWPTLDEYRTGLPLLWSEEERELLPPSARSLLEPQEKKFEKDWAAVQALLDGDGFQFNRDTYTWAWLVVNTRSLFYKLDTPEYAERARDDCMSLCPFVDYFNHSDEGCKVELQPSAGYTVTTNEPVTSANTQLFVSYGTHSNDFLLCEYGFVLPENRWDDVLLDAYILPELTDAHRVHLESEGFLGNYVFDKSVGFCYRTQAAIRMLLIPMGTASERALVAQWRKVLRGEDEGEREQPRVIQYLMAMLGKMREQGRDCLARVRRLPEGNVRDLLETRWHQILDIADEVEREMGRPEEGVPMRRYMM